MTSFAGGTSLIGTSGVDTLSLSGNSFPLYIGAQAANDVILFNAAATYSGVSAELGKGADNFTSSLATVSSSTISGNDGNDVISLGAISGSRALVNGNAGNDTFTVAGALTSGARVLGGADNDTFTVSAAVSSGSIVNGNKGNDTITVSVSTSSSTIFGGEGNDTLNAGASNIAVSFSGDAGNDTITGGQAAGATAGDSLYGGSGNDTINASLTIDAASDTLTGGDGVDTFGFLGNSTAGGSSAFVAGPDITVGATFTGADVITDFTAGSGGDIIDLNGTASFTYGGAVGGSTTNLTGGSWYAFSGTWSSGVFTVTAAGQGTDTLIAQVAAAGADAFVVAADAVVLRGVANTQITTANLV